MNKPLGKRPASITGTRKYTSNRRGLVGVGIREKVKPLLSDEELAAQADFIRECREGKHDLFDGRSHRGES